MWHKKKDRSSVALAGTQIRLTVYVLKSSIEYVRSSIGCIPGAATPGFFVRQVAPQQSLRIGCKVNRNHTKNANRFFYGKILFSLKPSDIDLFTVNPSGNLVCVILPSLYNPTVNRIQKFIATPGVIP